MSLRQWIKEGKQEHIANIKDNIKDAVNSLITTVSQNLNDTKTWLKNEAQEIKTEIKEGANGLINNVTQVIENAKDWLKGQKSEESSKTNEDTNVNGNSNPQITAQNQENGMGTYVEQAPTIESGANNSNNIITSVQDNATQMLDKYWEREDTIRKEIQEREDTAYQRAISDMRKSGINPNLVGINPSNSSGGLTNATRVEELGSTVLNNATQEKIAQMQRVFEEWETTIKNDTTISEGAKDRYIEVIKTFSGLFTNFLGSIVGLGA